MSIKIKTPQEIEIMAQGGRKLARIKKALTKKISEGTSAYDLEVLADRLIREEGGEPSFKKVPGYHWATCVNVNAGLVHGIPRAEVIFKKGDVVSVDLGMYYQEFHTDASITLGIGVEGEVKEFLKVGKLALEKGMEQVRQGGYVYDISRVVEEVIKRAGYSPIKALVGHGIGRALHEDPQIPCFVPGPIESSPKLAEGMVFAVEVMYAMGDPRVETEKDGWTIRACDGKITALFEETVAVTKNGPRLLTA